MMFQPFQQLSYLIIASLIVCINCTVEFNNDTVQCLDQSVEYQCTVTGTGFYALRWRIYDNNGTQIATTAYTSDVVGDSVPIGEEQFTVEQLGPSSPIVSNILFTVQSSISGYTVRCEESGTTDFVDLTINIPGIPASPEGVTIHTDTFTSSSVNISWTESPSPCVTGYRYNVSSTAIEESIIMESTSNSAVMVEGLVLSDDRYDVVVTAIDTANRNSNDSDPACFIFNVPSMVDELNVTNETETVNGIELLVEWEESEFDGDCYISELLGYRVTVFNSTDSDDVTRLSGLLPPGTTNHTFTGVPTGRTYNVTVTAVNGVGSSDLAFIIYRAPGPFVDLTPTTTTTVMSTSIPSSSVQPTSVFITTTMSSSVMNSSTSIRMSASTEFSTITVSPTSGGSSSAPVAAIAGGAVGGALLALIVIVLLLLLVCCCLKNKNKSEFIGDNKVTVQSIKMEEKDPEIGQALYQEVDKKEAPPTDTPTTPSTFSSGEPPATQTTTIANEQATYQDPNTIKRQQAPSTGDLYALPEKKPAGNQPQPSVYAELDLHNKSSTATTPSGQPVVKGSELQPVVYADVRGQ